MAYTNSLLIDYVNISPNKTSPRNHSIDTITIHCMATQWTAKQCCDYFAKEGTQASSNYTVGKDGSIGLSVEEKDRSWCSSSASNDNRAITIEVASDDTHPYKVTSKAYNALIDLLVDICERNKIKQLKWKGDKSLIGNIKEQNMTVHRWFANKDCPGDYLFNRLSDIADEVNESLSDDGLIVTNDESYIWDYFLDKIGNEYGVAGLMGNLYAESALKPNNLQNSYEGTLGYTDETYTSAVDTGSYSKDQFINDSAGYGLAQWTYHSRKQALYEMYENGDYSSIGSIELACDYLWYELENDFSDVLYYLQHATNVKTASNKVLHDFESPADQSASVENERNNYGVYYYNKYANEGEGGESGGGSSDDTDYEGITHAKKFDLLLMALGTDFD